jgi:hypothetical protein
VPVLKVKRNNYQISETCIAKCCQIIEIGISNAYYNVTAQLEHIDGGVRLCSSPGCFLYNGIMKYLKLFVCKFDTI